MFLGQTVINVLIVGGEYGAILFCRPDQNFHSIWVNPIIGIEDRNPFANRMIKAKIASGSDPLILSGLNEFDTRIARRHFFCECGGSVARPVIDDDHFEV